HRPTGLKKADAEAKASSGDAPKHNFLQVRSRLSAKERFFSSPFKFSRLTLAYHRKCNPTCPVHTVASFRTSPASPTSALLSLRTPPRPCSPRRTTRASAPSAPSATSTSRLSPATSSFPRARRAAKPHWPVLPSPTELPQELL